MQCCSGYISKSKSCSPQQSVHALSEIPLCCILLISSTLLLLSLSFTPLKISGSTQYRVYLTSSDFLIIYKNNTINATVYYNIKKKGGLHMVDFLQSNTLSIKFIITSLEYLD